MCALQIAGNGGACCECPQLTGCDCGGIACALTCESKAGTANLCGFEEFVASLPPKLYRKKEVAGALFKGVFSDGDCEGKAALVSASGGFHSSFGGGLTINIAVTGAAIVGTNLRVSFTNDMNFAGFWRHRVQLVRTTGTVTTTIDIHPGETFWEFSDAATIVSITITTYDPPYNQDYSGQIDVSGPSGPKIADAVLRDEWATVDEYDPDTCALTQEGDATRHSDEDVPFPLSSGGNEEPGGPQLEDYEGLLEEDVSATERTLTANEECEGGGPTWVKAVGDLVAVLSDEDTEDDAERRAADAISEWSECTTGCANCSAFRAGRAAGQFSFTFRKQRVKVSWTAEIGHTYKVTVRFVRRVLGSSGPALFYALEERNIVADVTSEETDWIDVPSDAGWETWPANCSVEDIS